MRPSRSAMAVAALALAQPGVQAYRVSISDADELREVCSGMYGGNDAFIEVEFSPSSAGQVALVMYEWKDVPYLGAETPDEGKTYICTSSAVRAGQCHQDQLGQFIVASPEGDDHPTSIYTTALRFGDGYIPEGGDMTEPSNDIPDFPEPEQQQDDWNNDNNGGDQQQQGDSQAGEGDYQGGNSDEYVDDDGDAPQRQGEGQGQGQQAEPWEQHQDEQWNQEQEQEGGEQQQQDGQEWRGDDQQQGEQQQQSGQDEQWSEPQSEDQGGQQDGANEWNNDQPQNSDDQPQEWSEEFQGEEQSQDEGQPQVEEQEGGGSFDPTSPDDLGYRSVHSARSVRSHARSHASKRRQRAAKRSDNTAPVLKKRAKRQFDDIVDGMAGGFGGEGSPTTMEANPQDQEGGGEGYNWDEQQQQQQDEGQEGENRDEEEEHHDEEEHQDEEEHDDDGDDGDDDHHDDDHEDDNHHDDEDEHDDDHDDDDDDDHEDDHKHTWVDPGTSTEGVQRYTQAIRYPVKKTGYYCIGVVPVTLVNSRRSLVVSESANPLVARQTSHAEYAGMVNFRNNFVGELPAVEYPKIGLYGFLSLVYFVLGCGWAYLCIKHFRELLPMQYYISGTILFLVVEMLAQWAYYRYINKHGGGTASVAFLFVISILNAARNSLSLFLLLIVSMGLSVVTQSLGSVMGRVRILTALHFVFGVIYSIGVVQVEIDRAALLVVIMMIFPLSFTLTAFLMWIIVSLNGTILHLSQRKQRSKLAMFKRLWRILVLSVIAIVAFFVISTMSLSGRLEEDYAARNWKYRWILLDASLAVIYLVAFGAIAWLWRPTRDNVRFAMSQELAQDEDEAEDYEIDSMERSNTHQRLATGEEDADAYNDGDAPPGYSRSPNGNPAKRGVGDNDENVVFSMGDDTDSEDEDHKKGYRDEEDAEGKKREERERLRRDS